MNDKELTKAELEIMQVLWDRNEAFVNELILDMAEPKPAYTTVSTIIRILVKKGFVAYKIYGKTHQYYPTITKEEYTFSVMMRVKANFFGNSYKNMVSFFTKKENLTSSERQELIKLLEHDEE